MHLSNIHVDYTDCLSIFYKIQFVGIYNRSAVFRIFAVQKTRFLFRYKALRQ